MFEGKAIEERLQNTNRVSTNKRKEVTTFARLIEKGKVNRAIKILEKSKKGGYNHLAIKHSTTSNRKIDQWELVKF